MWKFYQRKKKRLSNSTHAIVITDKEEKENIPDLFSMTREQLQLRLTEIEKQEVILAKQKKVLGFMLSDSD